MSVEHGSMHPDTTVFATSERDYAPSEKALVVEDIRESEIELRNCGYECDRITHGEMLSSPGI